MARRPALIKRKPKTVRRTRSEAYMINVKHLGDEPVFTGPLSKVDVIDAFNWYNYMAETCDARNYVVDHLMNLGRKNDAKLVKSLSDTNVPNTLGWTSRLISNGYDIPAETRSIHERLLSETLAKAATRAIETSEEKPATKQVISIQDRMREKAHDILGEIEGCIDDHIYKNEEFSLFDWLKINEIPASYSSYIVAKLAPVLEELMEAHGGKDPQLKEAYRHHTKASLKKLVLFYNQMLEDVERYSGFAKKTRAVRKPKPVSLEKKIKSLKFKKEDAALKIASIGPEKIIGAQELWAFNTKNKALTVFRALDRGGLDIKGTSISNYSDTDSATKSLGRKNPADIAHRILSGGKLVLKKIMDEFSTEKDLQVRMNEHTVLLRVVK